MRFGQNLQLPEGIDYADPNARELLAEVLFHEACLYYYAGQRCMIPIFVIIGREAPPNMPQRSPALLVLDQTPEHIALFDADQEAYNLMVARMASQTRAYLVARVSEHVRVPQEDEELYSKPPLHNGLHPLHWHELQVMVQGKCADSEVVYLTAHIDMGTMEIGEALMEMVPMESPESGLKEPREPSKHLH